MPAAGVMEVTVKEASGVLGLDGALGLDGLLGFPGAVWWLPPPQPLNRIEIAKVHNVAELARIIPRYMCASAGHFTAGFAHFGTENPPI